MPQPQPDSQNLVYTIVTILFALSLIAERIANMYKLYSPEMRLKKASADGEKIRERQVMWTALASGWIVAFIAGADFFTLIHDGALLNIFTCGFWTVGKTLPQTIFGFFLSGIFISLGSKFWHDMLDIVLQFSNLKKFQANAASANADNVQADALATNVTLFEPQLRGMPGYAGFDFSSGPASVNLKFDQDNQPDAGQLALITKTLGEGKFTIVPSNLKPWAMLISPGGAVHNAVNPPLDSQGKPAKGTIGGFVYQGNKTLLLTCYHCIKNPQLNFDSFVADGINDHAKTLVGGIPMDLGRITNAKMDPHTDIALIDPILEGNQFDPLIPTIGRVSGSRVLTNDDKGQVSVRKYGYKTLDSKGTFVGLSTGNVNYFPEPFKRHFDPIIMISGGSDMFSDGGDSGSFIVDENNAVVGLLFLTDGKTSYGIRPDFIELAFGITFSP